MNKFFQNFFLVLYPFYPLWAWLLFTFAHFQADKILVFLLLPMVIYIIWRMKVRVPAYLLFFILFTIYHFCSIFYFDLMPTNTDTFSFIMSDMNTLACLLFLVVENTNFDDNFISKMNRHILWIVALSLVISIIQIKQPLFFYNISLDEDMIYVGENRIASIYSWVSLNTVGVTFPILIAIL